MTMPPLPAPKTPEEITKQVKLAYNVPALETVKIAEPCPLTGRIISITLHFPDGCDALVDVAFGHEDTWVVPSEPETYIALNDATPAFTNVSEPVIERESLWAEFRNSDGGNAHAVAVLATIVGASS